MVGVVWVPSSLPGKIPTGKCPHWYKAIVGAENHNIGNTQNQPYTVWAKYREHHTPEGEAGSYTYSDAYPFYVVLDQVPVTASLNTRGDYGWTITLRRKPNTSTGPSRSG